MLSGQLDREAVGHAARDIIGNVVQGLGATVRMTFLRRFRDPRRTQVADVQEVVEAKALATKPSVLPPGTFSNRLRPEYEVTVFQIGWRLGGRCSASRSEDVRDRVGRHRPRRADPPSWSPCEMLESRGAPVATEST